MDLTNKEKQDLIDIFNLVEYRNEETLISMLNIAKKAELDKGFLEELTQEINGYLPY